MTDQFLYGAMIGLAGFTLLLLLIIVFSPPPRPPGGW